MKKSPQSQAPKPNAAKYHKATSIQNVRPEKQTSGIKLEAVEFWLHKVKLREESVIIDRREIPCTILDITNDLTITVYGGHIKSGLDPGITYISQKSRSAEYKILIPEINILQDDTAQIKLGFPFWFQFLVPAHKIWDIHGMYNANLQGIPSQRVFQGKVDNPYLCQLIQFVEQVKKRRCTDEFFNKLYGEKFMQYIIEAIIKNDFEQINLLVKAMRYCQNRESYGTPKSQIYFDAVLRIVNFSNRIPKPKEILNEIQQNDPDGMEESEINRDLKKLGLTWLIKTQNRASVA